MVHSFPTRRSSDLRRRQRRGHRGRRPLGRCLHRRSEEHTSELQSHHPISYAVFCLKKKRISSTDYEDFTDSGKEPATKKHKRLKREFLTHYSSDCRLLVCFLFFF